MTRLERKCFVASASAHGALALLLLIAPAIWVSRHPEEITLPVLTFLPTRLVDGATGGGGNPNVKEMPAPAPPAPPQPLTLAPPEPVAPKVEPAAELPAKAEPKPPKAETKRAETESSPPKARNKKGGEPVVVDKKSKTEETDDNGETKPGKKHTVELSFVRDKSASSSDGESDARARADATARAARAAQAAFSSRLNSVLGAIGQGMSSGTSIEVPGPGGEAFADYAQFVETFYKNAWAEPADVANNRSVVTATVVILRSGRVSSFQVTRRSRDPALDASVDRLKKLDFVAPFPEGAKDEKRTFKINFILQAER